MQRTCVSAGFPNESVDVVSKLPGKRQSYTGSNRIWPTQTKYKLQKGRTKAILLSDKYWTSKVLGVLAYTCQQGQY